MSSKKHFISLAKGNYKLSKEWNYNKNSEHPQDIALYSHKKVWWKCEKGHEWEQAISGRVASRKLNCPACKIISSTVGFLYPQLVKEIDQQKNNIDPFKLFRGSTKKIWWKCEKGHEWKTCINARTRKEPTGCPECYKDSKRHIEDPLLIKEWDINKNKHHYNKTGSRNSAFWICSFCKNEWKARIDSRMAGTGCPKCYNIRKPKKKSLSIIAPHLLKEYHPHKNNISANNISYGSNIKLWWKCKRGHEWDESPKHRVTHKLGCPYCSGKRVNTENSLLTNHPDLSKEWHEKNITLPSEVSVSSGKKVWWKCPLCNHEWSAVIANRSKGIGCPSCSKNIKLSDGTKCDSLVEAFFYLKYKDQGKDFIYNGEYPRMGKHRFDFYFPINDTYVEITSYHKKSERFEEYMDNIKDKQNHVEKVLHSKFKFINYFMSRNDRKYLKTFIVGNNEDKNRNNLKSMWGSKNKIKGIT